MKLLSRKSLSGLPILFSGLIATAISGCSPKGQPMTGTTKPQPLEIICFQHIGVTDHPIFPVLITSSALELSELVKAVPGLEFGEWADVVRLPTADFTNSVSKIAPVLQATSPSRSQEFGVFRISILGGSSISNTLDKSEVIKLLGLFPKDVIDRNQPLKKSIARLMGELGVS